MELKEEYADPLNKNPFQWPGLGEAVSAVKTIGFDAVPLATKLPEMVKDLFFLNLTITPGSMVRVAELWISISLVTVNGELFVVQVVLLVMSELIVVWEKTHNEENMKKNKQVIDLYM